MSILNYRLFRMIRKDVSANNISLYVALTCDRVPSVLVIQIAVNDMLDFVTFRGVTAAGQ